eukprot:CAMPEP_0176051188 /NCGR_PEP_ID=MMETSP0120_2-20121206/25447_1 /TAXON_ID=160619 /ORGANISM="Kryptoperidinium foliaceum, Strain CCMP 1326" /LENGTH=428 /DNA_ID=CAMNT_0017384627 /DNA_START=30 /DNA_END=1316 /DNA_ORIENTATION=-
MCTSAWLARWHMRLLLLAWLLVVGVPAVKLGAPLGRHPRFQHFLHYLDAGLYREPLLAGVETRSLPAADAGEKSSEWRSAIRILQRSVLSSANVADKTRGCNALLRMCCVLDHQTERSVVNFATAVARRCMTTPGVDQSLFASASVQLRGLRDEDIGDLPWPLLLGRYGWFVAGVTRRVEDVRTIVHEVERFIHTMPAHAADTEMEMSWPRRALWIDRAQVLARMAMSGEAGMVSTARESLLKLICYVGYVESVGDVAREAAIGSDTFPTDLDAVASSVPASMRPGCVKRLTALRDFATVAERHKQEQLQLINERFEHGVRDVDDMLVIGRLLMPFTPPTLMQPASDLLLQVVCNSPDESRIQKAVAGVISMWAPERPKDSIILPFVLGCHVRGQRPSLACTLALENMWRARERFANVVARDVVGTLL